MRGLSEYGVEHIAEDRLTPEEDAFLKAFFTREIRPLLFTVVVDKKHPVPFLKSGEIYIGAAIRKKTDPSNLRSKAERKSILSGAFCVKTKFPFTPSILAILSETSASRLEEAGVIVIYGLEELKVHSKLLLITLRDGDGVRTLRADCPPLPQAAL